jgi:N-acetyl-anhydromuramyl-L-alanine amidase AmpD
MAIDDSHPARCLLEDERDHGDILLAPYPQRTAPEFANPGDSAWPSSVSPSLADQQITAVCRPLPLEAVPDCRIRIGTKTAATNSSGATTIDLSTLANGNHDVEFRAPDTSDAEMGPGFRPDASKARVWRLLTGKVEVQGGRIVSAEPAEFFVVNGNSLRVLLQPAWLKAPLAGARPGPVDSIIIHHTAGNLQSDLNTFLYGNRVSIHYLVAPNGDIYKLVMEDRKASHAGYSYWQGDENLNGTSIGIEMTHVSGQYPQMQIEATVALIEKLHKAFPSIPAERVIGHSDVGICDPISPNPCSPAAPKRLGRKSTDPGSTFPWEKIEQLGLGLQITPGTIFPNAFGSYFGLRPNGRLFLGDNDEAHRFGGEILDGVSGAVAELQNNLKSIGYHVGQVDGDFGRITEMALRMFNQHMFSGSRHGNNSAEGRLNLASAEMLKRVLGEVDAMLVS